MPLLGTGVLAIRNGLAPGYDAEFVEWHVKEHIPERVAHCHLGSSRLTSLT